MNIPISGKQSIARLARAGGTWRLHATAALESDFSWPDLASLGLPEIDVASAAAPTSEMMG